MSDTGVAFTEARVLDVDKGTSVDPGNPTDPIDTDVVDTDVVVTELVDTGPPPRPANVSGRRGVPRALVSGGTPSHGAGR